MKNPNFVQPGHLPEKYKNILDPQIRAKIAEMLNKKLSLQHDHVVNCYNAIIFEYNPDQNGRYASDSDAILNQLLISYNKLIDCKIDVEILNKRN